MKMRFLLLAVFLSTNAFSQLLLSEIMFNPPGSDQYNEYVEVFNNSDRDSIDLDKWLLSDGQRYNQILANEQGTVLAPQSFAIILSPKYYTQSHFYDERIPSGTLRLTISHTTLGRNGLANSRSETVSIYRPDTSLVTSRSYRVPIADGYSEEKIIFGRGDGDENWAVSRIKGGTPGFRNSVTPLQYDLLLSSDVHISPEHITSRDSFIVILTVKNSGIEPITDMQLFLYRDNNNNGQAENDELLSKNSFSVPALRWSDSTEVSLAVAPQPVGDYSFIAILFSAQDADMHNNVAIFNVHICPGRGDVVINEIYNHPAPGQGCWIELYNKSTSSVDLQRWLFEFPYIHLKLQLTDQHLALPADSFIVFAQQGSVVSEYWRTRSRVSLLADLPRLSPQHDAIILKDANQTIMDFASYSIAEQEPAGISLERLETDSTSIWDYCPHPYGSTPGEHNALHRLFTDVGLDSLALVLKPMRPVIGDDILITCRVHNFGSQVSQAGKLILRVITEDSSEILETQSMFESVQSRDSVEVTFPISLSEIGRYMLIASIESTDDFYPINNEAHIALPIGYPEHAAVINEIMYDTEEKSQEWVEVYNQSSFAINIGKCWLKDSRKKVRIGQDSFSLSPGHYLVISNVPLPALEPQQNIVNPFLPELNNSGDDVVLLDPFLLVIDSLHYTKKWGGSRLISLERIRFEDASEDSFNWNSCTDSAGSTPGRSNSVSPGDYDALVLPHSIAFYPGKPMADESVKISTIVKNFGRHYMQNISVAFTFSTEGEAKNLIDVEKIDGIEPRGEKAVSAEWSHVPPGVHRLMIMISNPVDENSTNNMADTTIVVSYPPSTLIINEIMYNPAVFMPEWIEIFNKSELAVQTNLWSLADSDTSHLLTLSDSSLIIKPGNFLIISRDTIPDAVLDPNRTVTIISTSFPSLNNDTDTIYLFDGNDRIIDKVTYVNNRDAMRGRSLERVSPQIASSEKSNWMTCVAPLGHTAGRENSVFTRVLPAQAVMRVNPNPFSPDGDGFEDVVGISYSLPEKVARVNMKIYDMKGRMVRFLLNNEPSASQRTIFWDGLNDDGERCRMGIYIIFLQAMDSQRGVIQQLKKTVVLAHQL